MHSLTYTAAGVLLIGWAVYSLYSYTQARKNPQCSTLPGPTLLPFIGRIHDLPIENMWLKFMEWSQVYGSIYKTEMIGTKFVIISDEKIAEELLVKRAKYNSDRPRMRSVTDSKSSEGGMEYLPLMGRNEYWARQRKFTHSYLMEAANAHYYGVLNHEAKRWMFRLLEDPDNHYESLEDSAAKVMAQLTWDDPNLSVPLAAHAWKLLTQMSPAGPITNLITPLWHLPLAINPWKQAENKRHDAQSGWWMDQYQASKALHAKGEARSSWMRQYLEIENSPLSGEKEASAALGMLATVGIFTVAGPLHYFLVAMVHHPEWQAKAQQEVDQVCKGEMPTMNDSPNLPILRACIKETMRWRPNVPTGVAHEVEEDDFYDGMFIAKGTRILPLDWAFLRNPEKYPDPESYRPERWLEEGWPTYQAPLREYPTLKGMSSFGFGRRQCLGQTLTQDETLVSCGALLWAFNMRPKVDPATGKEIEVPKSKNNHLLIIKPDPFVMAFHPRSPQREEDIRRKWAETDGEDIKAREEFQRLAAEKRKEVMGWTKATEV